MRSALFVHEVGFVVTGAIWVAVIVTHELGRLLGLFWVLIGIAGYVYFRKKSRLPVWGVHPR